MNGLYDAKLDKQPVLAITGLQYHDLVGTHTQQDVALDELFMDACVYNERVRDPPPHEGRPHLHVEDPICCGGLVLLQQRDSHVVNRNSGSRLSAERAVMRVSMEDHVCAVAVHDFGQPRSTHVRINFRGFPIDGRGYGRIMQYDHPFWSAQLRQRAF